MLNNNEKDIPAPLIEAIKGGRVILFLGAGASREAKSNDGSHLPSTEQLTKDISMHFLGKDLSNCGLMQISEMASRSSSQSVVFDYIRNQLKTFKPSPAHRLIPTFRWHTLATTNYDTLVEDAYGKSENRVQDLLPFVKDSEPIETRKGSVLNPLVYMKLHGCIEHSQDPDVPLVLDPSHYERYRENRGRLFDRLSYFAHEMPILFVGYALNDPHIHNLIYRLNRKQTRPEYYVVSPDISDDVSQHWLSQRIVVIDSTFDLFMAALNKKLPEPLRQIKTREPSHDQPIQKHFKAPSDLSETLLKSLESDLIHVHSSMPTEEQSARDFYRGYDQGFAAIASGFDVQRRVSNDLIVQLIEDQPSHGVRFYLLRGPAGTGKTIALKQIAWEIAGNFNAPVLWFRENGFLKHHIIRELYDHIGERIFLVIDKAIKNLAQIEEVMRVALTYGIDISIISAERDSAWNVDKGDFDSRWDVRPYSIGRLVKPELEELIQHLETHSALGVLQALSMQERVSAFEVAERHLLVALHEVTHGKPFEDIVYDEYRSLTPQQAQQIYLDVCTLNQFGAPVRAGIIHRITGIPFDEYKDKFFLPLEEVVLTQKNPHSGDYEYKSRHSKIASFVFKRAFPSDEERVDQLERLIGCLDEGYHADCDAIRGLIKGRHLATLLTDVRQGRRVYDCMHDTLGDRWYTRHQRANFELYHGQGSLEEAENEGRIALELAPERTSVLHTLAEISRVRAQKEPDGLRKDVYRTQARDRLSKIKKDYSSLTDRSRCKLHLDEMQDALKATSAKDNDSVNIFAKKSRLTQQAIDEAIMRHPTDPDIIRLRANYFSILQEKEEARIALEQAWGKKPRGPSIGLQLAKIYQKQSNQQLALTILVDALERHPQDSRVHFATALYYLQKNGDLDRAGYHLARSYNSSDRNYEARYLHAQYLMLSGDGKRSAEVFEEVDHLAPPDYRPRSECENSVISKLMGRVYGRVATREESFAFLKLPSYPQDLYANISNSNADHWKKINKHTNVSFNVGFNRGGPVGVNIRVN